MPTESLQQVAVALSNLGDQPCLEELVMQHPSNQSGKWRAMLAEELAERFEDSSGIVAPVVLEMPAAATLLSRRPVCLMPLQAGNSRTGAYEPLHFDGSREVLSHALFATRLHRNDELGLSAKSRSLRAPGEGKLLRTLNSAGLSAFLAAYRYLSPGQKGAPLAWPGWVACTGVLRTTVHPGILPPVGKVECLWDKYCAIVDSVQPRFELVLLPRANETELRTKLVELGREMDPRVRFVETLQEAVDALWGQHAAPRLGELPVRDQVRHLEAEWFHAPYNKQHQEAVLNDAQRLLERGNAGQPFSALDRVICLTIRGHYFSHRGEEQKAYACFEEAQKVAKHDFGSDSPFLDLVRRVRLENALAVSHLGILDPDAALAVLRQRSNEKIRSAGEEGLFHQGTYGQALSLKGAHLLAAGRRTKAQHLLKKSVTIHERLANAKVDPARHACYRARAQALLGDYDGALASLLPPQSVRRTALDGDGTGAGAAGGQTDLLKDPGAGFVLLRIAHLCWVTGKYDAWIRLCAHLSLEQELEKHVLKEFVWPGFGLALQHAVILAEAGFPAEAEQLLGRLDAQVSGPVAKEVARELPQLYLASARLRVGALSGAQNADGPSHTIDTIATPQVRSNMERLLRSLGITLDEGPEGLSKRSRDLWMATLY